MQLESFAVLGNPTLKRVSLQVNRGFAASFPGGACSCIGTSTHHLTPSWPARTNERGIGMGSWWVLAGALRAIKQSSHTHQFFKGLGTHAALMNMCAHTHSVL